ncbi:MAG: hypothetical protein UX81_C0012G0003 [Parcubacteria group bacterium GW2011_GWA2_47_12]|nr:MAG: hypothetical protein UX81_C0012G0003 [Parcubacteria group bacterium GW2011_GWA2_47_12]
MRGTLYTTHIKKLAEKWRSSGKTYSEIRKRFGIPKSTLSVWFGKKYAGIFTREKQLEHLTKVRKLAIDAIKKRVECDKKTIQDKVVAEIKGFPLYDVGLQKSIVAALYWAEGSKNGHYLKFANTDPNLHTLFITLLRKCYKPNEFGFRAHVYVHYYHSIQECEKFWSDLLKIPRSQFWKTYVKKRSVTKRFRRNFMGICFLYHQDSKLRKEIMELAHQLYENYK